MGYTLMSHDSDEVWKLLTRLRERKFENSNRTIEKETAERDGYIQAIDDVISELIDVTE
ncbi:MAG: hypothetical protein J6M10_03715 [Clostridia bacterium]|nr:hypothetical protein [Clostridia bacterium]